jgi:glycosyltransferase-like protein
MPEPLRIALLTHSLNPRGGVVHTVELAEALHDAGHRVTVIAPALPGQRLFRPLRCLLETVPVGPAPSDLAAMVDDRVEALVNHLAQRVACEPFDVMHAQDSLSGNALATLRERGRIKGFMRTVHHLDDFVDPRVAALQLRGFLHADQVLCVSEGWVDTLRRVHGVEAALVHNGVDLNRYHPRPEAGDLAVVATLGLRRGAPLLLSVGGIEERKNTLRLLEAFVIWRRQHPHAQWLIAGGASLLDHGAYASAFRSALAASGLRTGPGGDVVIAGTVPDAAMPALYRSADVVAMPSLREGFGLVVLEALASGTPAVVSRIAPFTGYLAETDVAWADPQSPGSIADALQQALVPARGAGRAAAVPEVCLRHDWAVSAARHVALYRARRALSRVAAAAGARAA